MSRLIKEITPPILVTFFKKLKRKYGWFGNYRSWEEALRHSEGYDSAIIADKVKEALLKVKNGEAAFERDSVVFDKIEYSWPLLAGLMWAAARNKGVLNVLDFGGSLGGTYFQNRNFFDGLVEVHWSVVEQQKFVDNGNSFFSNEELKFYENLEQCFAKQTPQVVLFSCVLQYLAQPFEMIERVMKLNPEFIVVDNMPFVKDGGNRITVQKVDPVIYTGSYPCWILDKSVFLQAFKSYEMVENFESQLSIKLDNETIIYEGFIFKRKE